MKYCYSKFIKIFLVLSSLFSPFLSWGQTSYLESTPFATAPDFPDLSAKLTKESSEVIEEVSSQLFYYTDENPSAQRIQLYMLLGKAHLIQDSLRSSLSAFKMGLEDSLALKNRGDQVQFLAEIGNVYYLLGEYRESKKLLNEALKLVSENEIYEKQGVLLDLLGQNFIAQNYLEKAEEHLNNAIVAKRDFNDSFGLGVSFNLLARLKIVQQKFDGAQEFIDLSLDANRKDGLSIGVAENYLTRCELYSVLKDPSLVLLNAKAALEVADENNLSSIERETYKILSDAYAILGDFKLAYDALETYTLLEVEYLERLRGEEFARVRNRLLSDVEAKKQRILEQENLLKSAELNQQNEVIYRKRLESYSMIFGIILLLILVVVLFFQSRTRRRNDKRLLKVNKELKSALEEAEDLKKIAEEASHAKSQFLANMSHEIRTPLNAVIGMSTILNDTELTKEQEQYLKSIQSSSNGLLSLLNDLLDFSKIESGMVDIEKIPFDLENVVEEVMEMMEPSAEAKGIKILLEFEDALPKALVGDPGRLRQILINLIGNAIKFTSSGHVKLILSPKSKILDGIVVQFAVEDTGIGITEERKSSLFDPFTQADNSHTRKFGGSGLGLSICKRLTEIMEGDIWVESTLGSGSKFYFTIPYKLDSSADHLEEVVGLSRGKRLLIADDNETNRRILRIYGERIGMKVDEADTGYGALNLLQNAERYHLVIIDFQMPGMHGLELAEKIGEIKAGYPLPVIMLSSVGDRDTHEQAIKLGVSEYLNKPVKREALFASIAKVLSEVNQGNPVKKKKVEKPKELLSEMIQGTRDIKILLAEDNPMNQRVATILLNRMGLACKVVGNGLLAYESVRDEFFDLVLMDLQMPVMDGLESTKKIRSEIDKGNQPVIIAMTAAAAKEDEMKAFDSGMDGFLTKPVRAADLAKLIESKMK